jgi:proline dehydrogenase
MEGYSMASCNYSMINDTSNLSNLTNCSPEHIMGQMDTMKGFSWISLINMREELIKHLKGDENEGDENEGDEDGANDGNGENENESEGNDIKKNMDQSINELSNKLIEFMKNFNKHRKNMDESEKNMKKVIMETQKDVEIMDTFIEFLKSISYKTDKNIEPIEKHINSICDDIKNNNKIKETKKDYINKKKIFNQHLNIIRLINQMNVGSTCSICLQDNVDSFFDPCGHTICSKCNKSNSEYSSNTCPLCRKTIINTRKLYFS